MQRLHRKVYSSGSENGLCVWPFMSSQHGGECLPQISTSPEVSQGGEELCSKKKSKAIKAGPKQRHNPFMGASFHVVSDRCV